MKINLFYICLLIVVASCATKVPLNSGYMNSPSRIGLFIETKIESTGSSSGLGFGVVGALVSASMQPRSKYDLALVAIEPYINPKEKIKQLYLESFSNRGKTITVIDEKIDANQLKEFQAPNSSKKYFKKDLRYLKEKYQIDELLIVTVRYGMYARYKYGIETARYGKAYILPEIIDLKDNSILYKDVTKELTDIQGKWDTPPRYENLQSGISASIEKVIELEREKYRQNISSEKTASFLTK